MTIEARLKAALANQYQVEREIGAGGMATVFLARDLKHDRDVAVKVLHPDLGAALGGERFLSEIKTTAKLQHPHILPLIDSGEADTLLYYVMPYVVGESLRDKMEREGQLGVNEAIRIAREVAGALDYAHRQGVIHRDIKPENILLNDGQALVADFGIALAVSAAGGARMTQTGLSLGTPQYMSPEQAMGERVVDSRSDIYALGAVTYEMLTGEPPFSGSNVQAIVSKIMTQRPTPVTAVRDTVPPATEDAVMTALCKLPADRFATAAEFSRALTEGTGGLRTSSTIPHVGTSRRRIDLIARRVGLPAIPVAVAALAFAMWAWQRPVMEAPTLRYTIALDSSDRLSSSTQLSGSKLAISPDGSKIAYVGGPKSQIFVRNRNDFKSVALAGTEGALTLVFSPDGKQLAFGSFASELKVIPASGGATVLLTDSAVGRDQFVWGSDGFIYAPGSFGRGIFRIPAVAGAEPKRVTVMDSTAGETGHYSPSVMPDGKAMVFRVSTGTAARARSMVAVQKFGERTHRLLFEGASPQFLSPGYLMYRATNGSIMVVRFNAATLKSLGDPVPVPEWTEGDGISPSALAVSETGTLLFAGGQGSSATLAWVTPTGNRTLVDSTFQAVLVSYPVISPDGRRVAFGGSDAAGTNIWVKQLDRGAATKITVAGANSNYPSWTPDGRSITYYSNVKDPDFTLYTKQADGSGQGVEIGAPDHHPVESVWTPDGKWLIYRTSVTYGGGKGNLFALQAGGNARPVAIAATEAGEKHPAISPGGRWLAYSSNETGRFEIFVVPFPNSGATKLAVSSDGGSEPVWSRDGRQLFYRNAAGMMIAVPVEKGASFNTGLPRELFSAFLYQAGIGHRNYDVAPDGRFLMLWLQPTPADEKIYVVDNWFTELNKKFK